MSSSTLDLVWPPSCDQCSGHVETSRRPQDHGCEPPGEYDAGEREVLESHFQQESRAACRASPEPSCTPQTELGHMRPPQPAGVWPHGLREQGTLYEWQHRGNHSRGVAGPSNWPQDFSVEEAECLEAPLPLMSDNICTSYPHPHVPSQYPAQCKCLVINVIMIFLSIWQPDSIYLYNTQKSHCTVYLMFPLLLNRWVSLS